MLVETYQKGYFYIFKVCGLTSAPEIAMNYNKTILQGNSIT